jgi:hypothetical protein
MAATGHFIAGMLAGALMLGGTAAQGATRVDTAALSMRYTAGTAAGEIYLLSEEPGSVRISVESIGLDLSSGTGSGSLDAYDENGILVNETAATWGRFALDVADGYKVTGFALSSYVYGGLETAWHDGQSGIAGSYVAMTWGVNGASVGGFEYIDQAGVSMMSLAPQPGVLDGGDFTLDFSGNASATAQGIAGTLPGGLPFNVWSGASIGLYSMELTVFVSPVPEPGTWAMLLAGLGITGMVARRRRR